MLILMRKLNEEIFINKGEIIIRVVALQEDIVTIGVLAPDHMEIDRREIFLKKRYEARIAAKKKFQNMGNAL